MIIGDYQMIKKKMYFIALHVLRHTDVVITLHVNDSLMLLVVELL